MQPKMETRRYIILSILSITVSLQTLFAQSNSNSEYYDKAYSEITDMLEVQLIMIGMLVVVQNAIPLYEQIIFYLE